MFNKLSYKQKFFIVIGVFLILLFASYKKNFKRLYDSKKELNIINSKLKENKNLFNQLYLLENEVRIIDGIIGGETKEPRKIQQLVLDFVTNNQFKTNIVSISDTHFFSDEQFNIYTNQIEFEGEYEELIDMLYKIETSFNSSIILSSKIYRKKDFRNNIKKLYLKIILQNYEKI